MKHITNLLEIALLSIPLFAAGCAGTDASDEAADSTAQAEVGEQKAALRIGGGGLGVASCPGGGSPSCTQCSDAETCVYSCAGGYSCNIEAPDGPDSSSCSTKAGCLSFSGGFGGFGVKTVIR